MEALDRFNSKVSWDGVLMPHMETRCTKWHLKPNKYTGRAMFYLEGHSIAASAAAWILHNGEIPYGLWVLHLCNNHLCVRLDHLYVSTASQNSKDRIIAGNNPELNKKFCPQNHPYDEVNTRRYKGARYCRTCNRQYNREYYHRNKSRRLV